VLEQPAPTVGAGRYVAVMNDLSPRKSSRLSRSQREARGFRLVTIGGVAGAVTVVGAVLAIAGVIGWGVPFIAAAVLAVCVFLFRRMMPR
jgi:predicted MFS family arabinose efflux permease